MWNLGRKANHEIVNRHRMHHGCKDLCLRDEEGRDLHNANGRPVQRRGRK